MRIKLKAMAILILGIILMAAIMPITLAQNNDVAKIGESTYNSLYEAVQNAEEGDEIDLLNNTTENQTIVLDKGVTIKGNEFTITSSAKNVFSITTENQINIQNINVEASKRAIEIMSQTHNLKLENSILTVGERGISVPNNGNTHTNSNIQVIGTTIQKSEISNYNQQYSNNGNTRAISLWQYTDSTITVKNSILQGFSYVINVSAADLEHEFNNTTLSIENSTLKGRAAINAYGTKLNVEIKNSEILGLNNEVGSTEYFANLVFYKSGNNINISDTVFTNYQNEAGLNNENARQYMITSRGINNIKLSGNTTFTDTTNKIDSILEEGNDPSSVQITGGTYSLDVNQFLPEGYIALQKEGKYKVGLKAQSISIPESVEITLGEEYTLNAIIEPENTIEEVTYSSNDENIVQIDNTGKLNAKTVGSATITVKIGTISKNVTVVVKEKEEPKEEQNDIEYVVSQNSSENNKFSIGAVEEAAAKQILNESLKSDTDLFKKVEDAIKIGQVINVEIKLEELEQDNVNKEDKEKMLQIVSKDEKIHQYFDISVLINKGDLGKITKLTNKIKLSIKVPEELLKEAKEFYILKMHNGQVEKIEAELNGDNLEFETNEFSLYALAYEEKDKVQEDDNIVEENNNEIQKNDNNSSKLENNSGVPQTGDVTVVLFSSLIVLSIVGLVIINRKRYKRKH